MVWTKAYKISFQPGDGNTFEERDTELLVPEGGSIYASKDGNVYAINPTCTHLGCLLTWNNLDKTWDCPCHGSRFDYKGNNLYDPAFKNLETYEIE